jgi:two-component system sensor histidine kinase HydH
MKPTSPRTARWGLLITTVALGFVLVTNGVLGFLSARDASRSLIRTRGIDLTLSVQRALVRSGDWSEEGLLEIVDEMAEQGLRYVAIITPEGGTLMEAGEASAPVPEYRRLPRPRGAEPNVTWMEGGSIRVVAPILPRRPHQRWNQVPPWVKTWVKQGKSPAAEKIRRWAKRQAGVEQGVGASAEPDGLSQLGGRALMVLEYEPVLARTMTSRALTMLLVSLVAATVLLIAAVIFWRLSRRAEAMSDQLAQDRQLKALGEMSAVLGHELRNPLAALKGHAQLLVEILPQDHPGRRGADTVVREALRVEDLTGQILEFAKTGKVAPLPEDPGDVARSAMEQSGYAGIDLELEGNLPPWPLDRMRIERVLINLLRNAVQATEGDQPVEFKVSRDTKGLVFAVRDHGQGIPPGEEQWIFEPFHTKRVRGTGLGLAVSKRIVEAHGGRISAENHPSGGALFTVWLPTEYAVDPT